MSKYCLFLIVIYYLTGGNNSMSRFCKFGKLHVTKGNADKIAHRPAPQSRSVPGTDGPAAGRVPSGRQQVGDRRVPARHQQAPGHRPSAGRHGGLSAGR